MDLRWASLKPVLDRDIPVMVRASALRAIRDAIEWAAREDIRIILLGAGDAWRLADVLAEREIPVILSAVNALPRRRWEPYDTAFVHATKLREAGVPFAIGYPYPASERNLPYEAAKAVAHGLSPAEALKAITLYPAQILGIDDRLGSLETGKDATLIVTNGDPLDIRTHVEMAYIQGRPVNLASCHTQLYEKYQKKCDRE